MDKLADPNETVESYHHILNTMVDIGVLDGLIVGKATLGLMLAEVANNQVQVARSIYHQTYSGPISPILKIGIRAIEQDSLTPRDTLIYKALGSFLQTSDKDLTKATNTVNQIMNSVVEASPTQFPEATKAFLGHWKYCLTQLYKDAEAPSDLLDQLENCAQTLGIEPDMPAELAHLAPAPWVPNN